ncbi:MAG: UDP-N-acetyl-D-glucosamine dehydrogenase [Nitrosomonadaceae bacterium]|nr:UDP-N-acetyl-D-glucosamine dehydrogenase [Nitrosomonadaceae bacterium]|tara:strand:+ start:4505 stop:5809 length:1305 start_codon:yes stop_codon:yes gene_type:complete
MLLEKIQKKEAHIGVVGLGYVGLPLVIEFCKAGFSVIGLDIDEDKVEALSKGKSFIKHIPDEKIQALNELGEFKASTNFSLTETLDCVLICVPTPLNKNREPEMSYIVSTAKQISAHMKKGQLIILESTTYPGTTQEVLLPALESGSGMKGNTDFFVAYSPEREDPNNKDFTTSSIPKVIGSDHPDGLETSLALYSQIINTTVPVSSTRVAEATKLMENIFRSVNIALVNELKVVFDKMGIDVWEVIEASSTKPFGFMPFYPGPGLGGHCIPIDPFYLTWKAREYKANTRFIELAGEVNISMPEYVIQKSFMALNQSEKSIKNSKILLLGLAYKKNVDDHRESVTFKIMDLLSQNGATVDYNDPHIPEIMPVREYKQFIGKKSAPLENLGQYDLTIILTDHSSYDYEAIVEQSKIVVDTRNACGKIKSKKIIKA